ncbi:23S rRNA (pseudouridine(1915)-N(3))-methyltransferase RlmH [Pseudomonas sp. ABC1]|uniref:23S rRNA (pseudouridine(1915)-N(3))-methyltransferase RlmH n=1 Tax=Pseudomonas sp. ABC1 TaxID=2748080 RepID=UPI0015C3AB54|nr:23S rRNA (pseudouridine(1915)-N(3))-methyltransferase RlmH [Pseudomonas sp. ABC1]QLF94241.1 23S rRNA (pseudouridine(1915)-N(3))-methyltransferase RlmH [Pseudomonas sp. ABC1]
MKLKLIAVGSKMPRWVEDGWQEYAKRLPGELSLELVEIGLHTRGKNADVTRLIRQEGDAMLSKVLPGERIVTLEVTGRPWSTEQLAAELDRWRLDARPVNLMVGGPEGLAPQVCARSEQRWSLSPLTLPHPLVRILVGEQIYRAWTLLSGHPYHK